MLPAWAARLAVADIAGLANMLGATNRKEHRF
jgi:hypothetical protein